MIAAQLITGHVICVINQCCFLKDSEGKRTDRSLVIDNFYVHLSAVTIYVPTAQYALAQCGFDFNLFETVCRGSRDTGDTVFKV